MVLLAWMLEIASPITKSLYQLFGLMGGEYLRWDFHEDKTFFELTKQAVCLVCGPYFGSSFSCE